MELSYDANGNLLSDGVNIYTWNARNQLTQVSRDGMAQLSFTYDARGRRASKTVQGAKPTQFLYDGVNAVQKVQDGTVNPILTGLGVDEHFARNDVTGRTYFLTDKINSTVALSDAAGAVRQRYGYDPYGNVQTSDISSGFTNPYQYTGREADTTGLYYYRARYYSPGMAAFLSEDPLGFGSGQSSSYAYVGGDPISYRDPDGREGILGAIGGVVGGVWGGVNGWIGGDRGWCLAVDVGAGAATGALAGLTNGLSLLDMMAARAIISAGIEAGRQMINGGLSGNEDIDVTAISLAALGSLVGDGAGEAGEALGPRGSVAFGSMMAGAFGVPPAEVAGARQEAEEAEKAQP
jgi:RHS repeat-associated protein